MLATTYYLYGFFAHIEEREGNFEYISANKLTTLNITKYNKDRYRELREVQWWRTMALSTSKAYNCWKCFFSHRIIKTFVTYYNREPKEELKNLRESSREEEKISKTVEHESWQELHKELWVLRVSLKLVQSGRVSSPRLNAL